MIYQTITSINLCFFILLIATIFSSRLSRDKKTDIGSIFLIFSTLPIFIGGFICFIINFNFNFNFNLYTNINLFIFNMILIIYVFKKSKVNFKKLFQLNFKSEFRKFDKIIISIFFFLLFLIAITPVTDADSILYHLNFAKDFINELQYNANLLNSLIGYIEFFNILPFFHGSTNFISIHSFISFVILFFWILKNENIGKNKKFLIYLTISCPVLFYSFDSEKPFLIGIFLMIYILLDNLTTKNTKIFSKYFILTLLPLVKLNFIIPSVLLIIYFLFLDHQKKEIKSNIIVKVMIISFLTYLPLLTFKLINFHNPFAPFLYEFFPSEFSNISINLLLDAQTYVYGASSINESKSLIQLLYIFVNITKPYDSLGIGLIILLFFLIKNLKEFNNKILIFLLLTIIINLFATPYSSRFFLQMYLIFCIFFLYSDNRRENLKNNLFLGVLKIQLIAVTLMMSVFCYININIFLKDDLTKAIYGFDRATKLNKIFLKNQKVITESSIFNDFVHMPVYNLAYSMNETDVNNFKNKIIKEKFKYYVSKKKLKKIFITKKNIRLTNPLFNCFSLKDTIKVNIANKTNYSKQIFLKNKITEHNLYIYQKKKC